MSVEHEDSIDKVIDYFATVTKAPFSYGGNIYAPTLLKVSDSLACGYTCPPGCGACCQWFSLDYIDGEERPDGLTEGTVEFNGRPIRIWTDYQDQDEDWSDRCHHLSSDARCRVHGMHPFSCDFELIRVEIGKTRNYNTLGVEKFGRSWQMTRLDGRRRACCEILPPTEESISDNVRKMERLQEWARYFGLSDTWVPRIIAYLQSGEWREGPLYLGGPKEAFYVPPAKHPGRERLYELIEEGTHTRKEIMAILTSEYPYVPKSAFGTILTDAKNPKYSKFDRQVVIVNGIWQF